MFGNLIVDNRLLLLEHNDTNIELAVRGCLKSGDLNPPKSPLKRGNSGLLAPLGKGGWGIQISKRSQPTCVYMVASKGGFRSTIEAN